MSPKTMILGGLVFTPALTTIVAMGWTFWRAAQFLQGGSGAAVATAGACAVASWVFFEAVGCRLRVTMATLEGRLAAIDAGADR